MTEQHDIVDIGVNLAHRSFHRDRQAVIHRAFEAGVRTMVITGTSQASSQEAQRITREYAGLSCVVNENGHICSATADNSGRFRPSPPSEMPANAGVLVGSGANLQRNLQRFQLSFTIRRAHATGTPTARMREQFRLHTLTT